MATLNLNLKVIYNKKKMKPIGAILTKHIQNREKIRELQKSFLIMFNAYFSMGGLTVKILFRLCSVTRKQVINAK